MAEFQLDTSGAVEIPNSGGQVRRGWLWSDLSPFEQGYVEAMMTTHAPDLCIGWRGDGSLIDPAGFSDLAPETLAAIRKDCAAFLKGCGGTRVWGFASDGRLFWEGRQRGHMPANYPPLTVTLGDDGKVYTRAA